MMTYSKLIEEIEFLVRSECRIHILNTVAQETTITSQELRKRLDASRTTVTRNLDALVERGWLQNTSQEYKITPCGDLVTAEFENLADAIRMSRELEPFMKWIEVDELGVDLNALADAEIVAATASDPYAPVNKHIETLRQADNVRLLLPSIGRDALEVCVQRLRSDTPQYEIVAESGCAETLQESPQYTALFEEMADYARVEYYVHEGAFPYYIGLLDGIVQLGVENDEGVPRALLETGAPEVRRWVEEVYTEYKSEATVLTPKKPPQQQA